MQTYCPVPHLMKMHNSFATGVMRTPAIWKVHIARPNLLWRIVRKEKGGAYLVSYKDTPTSILEIRGEATSVIALLKNYLIEHTLDSVVIAHPNTSDPVFGLLHESAVDFHVENCDQIQILNVDFTWNKIVPAIAGNKISRSMLDSVALKDRSLVLGRVFGFLDGIPGFPKRLMHLNQIRPVDWWIPDTDKV